VLFAAEELLVDVLVEVEGGADEDVLVKIEEREVELEVIDVAELTAVEVEGGVELDDEEDEDDVLVVVVDDFEVTSTTPAAAIMMITTTTIAMTTLETALPSTDFIEYL
jgi:hypothetical protein